MTGDHQTPPLFDLPSSNPGHQLFNADDAPLVMAYRLGQVEVMLRELSGKFDQVAQLYVNHAGLTLILAPLREKIEDLESTHKNESERKSTEQGQLKLAMIMAIVVPLVTLVINMIFAYKGA